jgi:hypothetical protein
MTSGYPVTWLAIPGAACASTASSQVTAPHSRYQTEPGRQSQMSSPAEGIIHQDADGRPRAGVEVRGVGGSQLDYARLLLKWLPRMAASSGVA